MARAKKTKEEYKADAIAKAKEYKGKIEGQLDTLANLTDDVAGQSEFKRWLTLSRYTLKLSFRNQILIMLQCDGVTLINTYMGWKTLGYQVKKGEKAIVGCYPMARKIERDNGDTDSYMAFGYKGMWFDISQVEATENAQAIASPSWCIHGDLDQRVLTALENHVMDRGIAITYVEGFHAYGMSEGGKITLRGNMERAEQFGVLAHELAHEILHKGDLPKDHTRSVKEIEAEAVAYIVAETFGIDMSGSAFYLATWKGDRKEVQKRAERIVTTAKAVIEAIEKTLEEGE